MRDEQQSPRIMPIVVFITLIAAGALTNVLSLTLARDQTSLALLLKAGMVLSFPSVFGVRWLAALPSFPRGLLWPAFWLIQSGWALLAALIVVKAASIGRVQRLAA